MSFHPIINTYHLLEGARQAQGLTVIIDVFRAFSLECYLYAMEAGQIRPVGDLEEAYDWKLQHPDCVLIGERGGKMCDGFDFGNSPSSIIADRIKDQCIIHTTSAGTQGIANAIHADQIITGSLVNAKAIASYIRKADPEEVSLVCMGLGGKRISPEDELCAAYIRALLLDEPLNDFDAQVHALRQSEGAKFFNSQTQSVFPENDFWMCIDYDRFDFVIRVEKDRYGFITQKVSV